MTGAQYQRVITYPTGLPAGGFNLGKILGGAVKIGAGFLAGGPVGALAAGATLLTRSAPPQASPGGGLAYQGGMSLAVGGGQGLRLAGSSALSLGGGGGGGGGSCMTKDGRPRRIRRDGKCWKRPSMNPLNPSAARRAIRRIDGARRMLRSIERQLPKAKASSAGRRKCGCK